LRVNENATTLDQIKVAGAALSVDDALDALLKTLPASCGQAEGDEETGAKTKGRSR